jgi:hypothetical protein
VLDSEGVEDRIPDDMKLDQEGQIIHPGTRSKDITSVKSMTLTIVHVTPLPAKSACVQ